MARRPPPPVASPPAARSSPSGRLTLVDPPRCAGIVLLGPPGAGKGTQAELLAVELGIANISTGEILRTNVATGTALGRRARRYMDAGDLVPDDVVTRMVFDRLSSPDCGPGYLLDGFPRTVPQARRLDAWLADGGLPIGVAINLDVAEDELLRRLVRRAAQLGRSDDTAETIRHRLEVFGAVTRPLVAHYAERGLLVTVDALGTIEQVKDRIRAGIETVTGTGVRPPAGAAPG
jgi:adenylate kinase